MRKLILTALILPFLAQARPDVCLNVKTTAGAIMQSRQAGVDAQVVVELTGKNSANDGVFRMYMHIVIDAYQLKVHETDMYRQAAVKEFANKYYIACWKGTV